MTPEQEKRLNNLAETVRGMNVVPSGISLVGGFPELPKNVSGMELLQHIEKAHENFALRGDKNVTIEGNLKTGLAINVRCPPQGAVAGGVIPSPVPPPPECRPVKITMFLAGLGFHECDPNLFQQCSTGSMIFCEEIATCDFSDSYTVSDTFACGACIPENMVDVQIDFTYEDVGAGFFRLTFTLSESGCCDFNHTEGPRQEFLIDGGSGEYFMPTGLDGGSNYHVFVDLADLTC